MTLEVRGQRVFAAGMVRAEGDWQRLTEALATPDKSRPIVFYCAAPHCWLAVNAADLPVVQKVPVAVIH